MSERKNEEDYKNEGSDSTSYFCDSLDDSTFTFHTKNYITNPYCIPYEENAGHLCSSCPILSSQKLLRHRQQRTRATSWAPDRGHSGAREQSRPQSQLSYPCSSIRNSSRENLPQVNKLPEQGDKQLPDTDTNIGGILQTEISAMQPIRGKLLPMHEQLHTNTDSGILSGLQSGNGSVSVSLQGCSSRCISEDDGMYEKMKEKIFLFFIFYFFSKIMDLLIMATK